MTKEQEEAIKYNSLKYTKTKLCRACREVCRDKKERQANRFNGREN